MGKLYVTEYSTQPIVRTGQMGGMGQEPCIVNASSPITFSTHAESAAFNANTKFIRVHTDSICSVKIGPAVTATANDARMAAGTTEYFGVRPGDIISVIANT